jgi:hypothetical protein
MAPCRRSNLRVSWSPRPHDLDFFLQRPDDHELRPRVSGHVPDGHAKVLRVRAAEKHSLGEGSPEASFLPLAQDPDDGLPPQTYCEVGKPITGQVSRRDIARALAEIQLERGFECPDAARPRLGPLQETQEHSRRRGLEEHVRTLVATLAELGHEHLAGA